jgi:hypothetical protein
VSAKVSARSRKSPERSSAEDDLVQPPLAPSRSLSAGVLAMAPLLAGLEWVLWSEPGAPRNAGVRVLDLALQPLGERADLARWVLLALAVFGAFAVLRLRGVELGRTLARIALEGLAFALVLGPLLVLAARVAERWIGAIDVSWDPTAEPPTLAEVGLVAGAGAWEELLFRVGLYSLVYLIGLRFAAALGAGEGLARFAAEVGGLALSTLAFAAAHFEPVTGWLGLSERPFRLDSFAWLCLGGLALGLIFRWRGPGVAAWAHALFNVALWIGVDPDVIW